MKKLQIYGLYENDELVFKGTAREILDKYDIRQDNLWVYVGRGIKLFGKYRINKLDDEQITPPKKEHKKRLTKYEKDLDYLIRHLREYGNTLLNYKPNKYIEDLKAVGLDCTYRKAYERTGESGRILSHYYIIEVKK